MYKSDTTGVTSKGADRFRLRFIQCSSIPNKNETIVRTTDEQRVGIIDKTNSVHIVLMSCDLDEKQTVISVVLVREHYA